MPSTTFRHEDCELDFGAYSLGGDWLLTIETADEGFSFRLIDAESCKKGVSKLVFAVIQEWIDADTAPRAQGSEHKSLVRQAYENHLAGRTADDEADDRGCYEYHQREAA